MKKRISQILMVALATVMGLLIIAFIAEIRRCPHFPKRLRSMILSQPYSPGPDIDFKWQMSASGDAPDGGRFDDSQYMSTDCVQVSVTYYSFPSADTAKKRFHSSLETARKVYAKRVESDTDTNPSDQRIAFASQADKHYEILHRNGNRLLQIESSSLSHALEYERRLGIHVAGARP